MANLFKTRYCALRLNSKYLNWFSKLILLLIFSKIAVFIFCLKHFDFDNSVSRKIDSPSNPLSISTASLLLTSALPVIHTFAMSFMVLESAFVNITVGVQISKDKHLIYLPKKCLLLSLNNPLYHSPVENIRIPAPTISLYINETRCLHLFWIRILFQGI